MLRRNYLRSNAVQTVYANDNSAFVPQIWAQESLAILEENIVAANLVHRDFQDEIAQFGDTVNTRKPGEFTAQRKTITDNVTDQDATATNVAVVLNQHVHVTFVIFDGEESKAMKDLIETYLHPAMLAQARFLDQIVLGQFAQFTDLTHSVGRLGVAGTRDNIVNLRQKMNDNKVYQENRQLVLNTTTEADFLKLDIFTQAQQVGDDGTALREAFLGRKFGFNTYTCQNMSSIATGNTTVTGAINNAAGYVAGTTSLTVDGLSAAITNGTYVNIAGDDRPQRVTSTTGGATPTAMVITPGLASAVVDNAVITLYTPGQINNAAGYAIGWSKALVIDGFTVAPRVGQIVNFTTTSTSVAYTIVGTPTTTSIVLDRPLEVALVDNDYVCIGPAGHYNFAFHKNAVALVVRPLSLPKEGTGARAANASYKGLSMRAVITYDGKAQGHRVTLDLLCGVKVLDAGLGATFYA